MPAVGEPDVMLDVQAVLIQFYEAGKYRERPRYDQPRLPPLPAEQQASEDGWIHAARPGDGQVLRSPIPN